jgi:ABC-type dipeptide/oligopeptide/nickel transport system permease subunit
MISEILNKLLKDPASVFGLIVVLILVFVGVFATILAPHDPYLVDLSIRLQSPSSIHLLGTDHYGRDILSRLIYGARISLEVGIIASLISLTIGVFLGILAGYYGGITDNIIMRITDIMFGFPALLFLIAITAAFQPSLQTTFLAIGFVTWPSMARIMRGQVLTVKSNDYVTASRSLGSRDWTIIVRHVLPNCLAPVIVAFSMGIAGAIMAEASLSFIGLGAQPPEPSWGSMIYFGKDYLRTAPWLTLYPGIAIALAVLGFNLLGEGLRDALDPKMLVQPERV